MLRIFRNIRSNLGARFMGWRFRRNASRLGHKNPAIRERALEFMGRSGNKAAVEKLSHALLNDNNPFVRRRAADMLGKSMDKTAVNALASGLRDRHPDVRLGSAKALGELGDLNAVNGLVGEMKNSLSSPLSDNRIAAEEALGQLAPKLAQRNGIPAESFNLARSIIENYSGTEERPLTLFAVASGKIALAKDANGIRRQLESIQKRISSRFMGYKEIIEFFRI